MLFVANAKIVPQAGSKTPREEQPASRQRMVFLPMPVVPLKLGAPPEHTVQHVVSVRSALPVKLERTRIHPTPAKPAMPVDINIKQEEQNV